MTEHRTSRRLMFAALSSLLVVLLLATGAADATISVPTGGIARERQSSPNIVVTAVTPWVQPDGNFRVELHVDGQLPSDATISSLVHQRIRPTSRTSLRAALDAVLANDSVGDALQSPISQPIATLGDPAVGIVVDLPVRSSRNGDDGRVLLPNPGIHPVTITITDGTGAPLATSTVFLNRLPSNAPPTRDGSAPQLSATIAMVIDGPPALRPSGEPDLDEASLHSIDAASRAIAAAQGGPFTLAIRPNLLAALARSKDTAEQSTLAGLREAVTTQAATVTIARMPYVDVDFGGLIDTENGGGELLRQIALGDTTTFDATGVQPNPSTWYDGDTITSTSLDMLAALGAKRVSPPADRLTVTNARVDAKAVTATAVALPPSELTATSPDTDIARQLLDQPSTRSGSGPGIQANRAITMLMTEWFDAATASDGAPQRSEFPGPSSVIDVDPTTSTAAIGAFYAALATPGPTAGPITLDPAAVPSSAGLVAGKELTGQLPSRSGGDQSSAVRAMIETRATIDGFRTLAPTATEPVAEWGLIDAQTLDRSMSGAQRDRYHQRVTNDIRALTAQVRLPPERRVVITARDATIPLRFRNDLPYPVQVQLWIRSVRLDIEGGDRRLVTLQPGDTVIDLKVTARAPGGSLLRIDATSPDGQIVLPAVAIPVTASVISGVGAALSVISLLFLAVWWSVSIRRDRRRRRSDRHDELNDNSRTTDDDSLPSDEEIVHTRSVARELDVEPGTDRADSVEPSG